MSVAFGRMVRAEWTKFRTVRAWVAGLAAGLLAIFVLAVATAAGSTTSCGVNDTVVACPVPPAGPDGQAVQDTFAFVHRELSGDGSVTVRVASLRGALPWAKAGLLIKDGTRPGASYAAVMVTAGHGTRLQHDFTQDRAGSPGAAPRWLRLTRTGQQVSGAESADGREWRTLGTVRPAGLGARARVGMFVASPDDQTVRYADLGGVIARAHPVAATGVFDHLTLQGDSPGPAWTPSGIGGVSEAGGVYTVSGGGDIAPLGARGGATLQQLLTGVVLALIAVIVVATVFVTAEYRRGLIAASLLAGPRRGLLPAAKAVVAGAVTFAGALAALTASALVGLPILRANGNVVLPVPAATQVGVVAGTAAQVALTAVLAVGLGAWLRRAAPAVIVAVAAVVLPYVLATTSLLAPPVGQWLLRLTPAAGFAVQQSVPSYAHVPGGGLPQEGDFPLPGWAGLAVLAAYAALALALGSRRLGRGDA
ncbi:ABC transporter permease subunit [Nonomuraea endophytica]|uniref:Regulation of enolase protein 1 (Concanavalin A-like superfamily) n=1 Tax=Nonomuraea endophytica TaxID=714136 RepID=A0A7W8AAG4_9ACTN|nr:ABC transporter permease subunit [Nonomuraea endophytica]MBB5081635.1 regulation of enolase protein 1 (concanavalin A-like superfamily) [Nonomuraea endophytica]